MAIPNFKVDKGRQRGRVLAQGLHLVSGGVGIQSQPPESMPLAPPSSASTVFMQVLLVSLENARGMVNCTMKHLPQSQRAGFLTLHGSSQTRTVGHTTRSGWHVPGPG